MYVCHCKVVSQGAIDAAISSGARTVADVTARCRAGGGCGGCHGALQRLLNASAAMSDTASAAAA